MERVETRDLHAHYFAPSTIDRIRSGEFPGVAVEETGAGPRFTFPTTRTRALIPGMDELPNRIAHLDECRIDIQVLSTWIDMFGSDLPHPEVAARYHTAVNEGLAEAVEAQPDRLRFYASVPLPFGEAAAAVLEDAVTRLGAVGSMIGTNIAGRYFDGSDMEPFWAASERLDVPVELHPIYPAASEVLDHDELSNFLGNPFDTTIAATSLIFNGVLDRHPALRLVLVHGGGYTPYALGRVTHGRTVRGVAPALQRPPIDYLDRFAYDTVVYDPRLLRAMADVVGVDRLVLGTDYPFNMEPPRVVETVRETLGEDALRRIEVTARSLS